MEGGLRRRELADFLRTRRSRLSLDDYGLSAGSNRRTKGLRREEVARLAGVSPSWYTKLEQGRDISVSTRFLGNLADALRLNAIERMQLSELAASEHRSASAPDTAAIIPALQRMIDAMPLSPAFIMTARADYISSNVAADAVFGDYKTLENIERNLLVNLFLNKNAMAHASWEDSARYHVSVFRSAYGRNADDPAYAALVDGLLSESAIFRKIWGEHELQQSSIRSFLFNHAEYGEMKFEYFIFHADINMNVRVDIFTPTEESGTREKVERAMRDACSIGTI